MWPLIEEINHIPWQVTKNETKIQWMAMAMAEAPTGKRVM